MNIDELRRALAAIMLHPTDRANHYIAAHALAITGAPEQRYAEAKRIVDEKG